MVDATFALVGLGKVETAISLFDKFRPRYKGDYIINVFCEMG